MAMNERLFAAKNAKNDEFYTQYNDIQREVNAYLEYNPNVFRDKIVLLPCDDPEWSNFTRFFAQNFEKLGLKKLISTSYAADSKPADIPYQLTFFETESPEYDESKTRSHGKIFTLTKASAKRVDIDDLKWKYLDGDGDFRSDEIKKLRDSADIIVTNPPFSLFRDFLGWIIEADKKFLIIGNKNSINNKETFPLLKTNKMWIGCRGINEDMWLIVPEGHKYEKIIDNVPLKHIMGCWFTNLDHGRRHKPISLMTMADNIKYSKHEGIKGHEYQKYDNYDAIEVPYVDAIPDDYTGVMGVPITFLGQYCPEQFEILGCTQRGCHDDVPELRQYDDYWEVRPDGAKTGSSGNKTNGNGNLLRNDGKHNYFINKDGRIVQSAYGRIFIRKKAPQ